MIEQYNPTTDKWVLAEPIKFHEGFLGKIIGLFRKYVRRR